MLFALYYLARLTICQCGRFRSFYCDLLSLFGVVDVGELALLLDDDPDVSLDDDLSDDGGELDVVGGELIAPAPDVVFVPDEVELDVEPVDDDGGVVDDDDGGVVDDDDGGVVDDEDDEDGDGVTVGGDVVLDVFDSRWQPATPSARPVQSSVTNVTLLIVNLQRS